MSFPSSGFISFTGNGFTQTLYTTSGSTVVYLDPPDFASFSLTNQSNVWVVFAWDTYNWSLGSSPYIQNANLSFPNANLSSPTINYNCTVAWGMYGGPPFPLDNQPITVIWHENGPHVFIQDIALPLGGIVQWGTSGTYNGSAWLDGTVSFDNVTGAGLTVTMTWNGGANSDTEIVYGTYVFTGIPAFDPYTVTWAPLP